LSWAKFHGPYGADEAAPRSCAELGSRLICLPFGPNVSWLTSPPVGRSRGQTETSDLPCCNKRREIGVQPRHSQWPGSFRVLRIIAIRLRPACIAFSGLNAIAGLLVFIQYGAQERHSALLGRSEDGGPKPRIADGHRTAPTGRDLLCGGWTPSQGFTLGYSLRLPTGGGSHAPSNLSRERTAVQLSQGFTLGYSLGLPTGGGSHALSNLSRERTAVQPSQGFTLGYSLLLLTGGGRSDSVGDQLLKQSHRLIPKQEGASQRKTAECGAL